MSKGIVLSLAVGMLALAPPRCHAQSSDPAPVHPDNSRPRRTPVARPRALRRPSAPIARPASPIKPRQPEHSAAPVPRPIRRAHPMHSANPVPRGHVAGPVHHHRHRHGGQPGYAVPFYVYPPFDFDYFDGFGDGFDDFDTAPAPSPYYWYWCASAQAYYPYVTSCPEGWQAVIPNSNPYP